MNMSWRITWARLGLGPAINGHPVIVFQSAQILYARGEKGAAEEAFREVLERDPRHLKALEWLACLLQNQRRFAEADAYRTRKAEIEAEPARAIAEKERAAASTEPDPAPEPST
jgi:hypothetical protein